MMHIAQNWRLNNQRYALKGVRCESCGKAHFPPREVCPHCADNRATIYTLDTMERSQVAALQEAVELQQAAR